MPISAYSILPHLIETYLIRSKVTILTNMSKPIQNILKSREWNSIKAFTFFTFNLKFQLADSAIFAELKYQYRDPL